MGNSKELEDLLKLMSENQRQLFDKLTRAQKPPVRPAGTKSKAPLAANELQKLKAEAEAFKASQRKSGLAISQLVTAKLDAAISKGDIEEIRRALLEQRGMYDDCNCTGAF